MKKLNHFPCLFLVFIMLLQISTTNAQDGEMDREFKKRKNPEEILELSRKKWLERYEYGFNFFTGTDADTLGTTFKQMGSVKWNLAIQRRFYVKNFFFAAGFGYSITEFRFRENLVFDYNTNSKKLEFFEDPDSTNEYGKSKLQVIGLRLPLEIGLQFKKFQTAFGVYADAGIFHKQKRKFENDTYKARLKITDNDILQTEVFQYGVSGRIGFNNFMVYVNYNLSSYFTDKGPDVNAVQIGITFNDPFKRKTNRKWLDTLKKKSKVI